jgi:oral-facial-digital syndrome 1 protein
MKDSQKSERLMPFKTLEERMMKYKKELEAKYANDLESEVRRLKEFEMSKLRIEEAQKYRQKIQEYRDELEVLQSDKLRELKLRESEAWERIKNRERDLDKQAFE